MELGNPTTSINGSRNVTNTFPKIYQAALLRSTNVCMLNYIVFDLNRVSYASYKITNFHGRSHKSFKEDYKRTLKSNSPLGMKHCTDGIQDN